MGKKVVLSERQLRGLFDTNRGEYEMMYSMSYNNPLTYDMCDGVEINEGLVKTYPFETMRRYVCEYFNIPERLFHEYQTNGVKCAAIDIPKNPTHLARLVDKAMNLCGYSFSQKMELDDYVRVHYEPKFQSEVPYDGDFLYHVTHHLNVPKIENIGLCPSHKNKRFNYNDRVYLFDKNVPRETLEWFASNINAVQARGARQGDKNRRRDELFCILKVKNDGTFSLHDDPNFKYGLWTSDNIPPRCILGIEDYINFNGQENYIK